MTTRFVRATELAEAPLDAAADFYARVLPGILDVLEGVEEIVVGFVPAEPAHRAWRLAAIQELARAAAPCRVNGVVCPPDNPTGCAEAINYLHSAPGITGQLLAVDGKSTERG